MFCFMQNLVKNMFEFYLPMSCLSRIFGNSHQAFIQLLRFAHPLERNISLTNTKLNLDY